MVRGELFKALARLDRRRDETREGRVRGILVLNKKLRSYKQVPAEKGLLFLNISLLFLLFLFLVKIKTPLQQSLFLFPCLSVYLST